MMLQATQTGVWYTFAIWTLRGSFASSFGGVYLRTGGFVGAKRKNPHPCNDKTLPIDIRRKTHYPSIFQYYVTRTNDHLR